MSSRALRYLSTGVLLTACAILTAGCEDETAAARQRSQDVLETVSADLEMVMLTSSGDADTLRSKLREIARTAGNLPDAGEGQKSAGALVAATAQRHLGRLGLEQAAGLAQTSNRQRSEVHGLVDATLRLMSAMETRERTGVEPEQRAIQAARTAAQADLRMQSERLAELDGPISERKQLIDRNRAEAARLKADAIALRREAENLGPADGLERRINAIELERSADQREYENAKTDLELGFDLRPEHELATARTAGLQTLINDLDDASRSLSAFEQASDGEVASMRTTVGEFRGRIEERLREIEGRSSGPMSEALDDAAQALDAALKQAKAAVRGAGRDSAAAKLEVSRVQRLQGQLAAIRAADLAGQIALLERVERTGAQVPADVGGLESQHADAVAAARAAFDEAKSQIESLTGPEIDVLRTALDDASTLVAGGTVERMVTMESPGRMRPGGRTPAGASSPQELADLLNGHDNLDPDAVARLLRLIEGRTPNGEAITRMLRATAGPQARFQAALVRQFGADAVNDMASGGAGGMGGADTLKFSGAEVVDETTSSATIDVMVAGQTERLQAFAVGGSWYLDAATVVPQMASMDPMQIQMASQMASSLIPVMDDMATRIDAGEFSTLEEAMAAFTAEMLKLMGGGIERPGAPPAAPPEAPERNRRAPGIGLPSGG